MLDPHTPGVLITGPIISVKTQVELDSKEIQAKNIQSPKHRFALASFLERATNLNQKQFFGPYTHLDRP